MFSPSGRTLFCTEWHIFNTVNLLLICTMLIRFKHLHMYTFIYISLEWEPHCFWTVLFLYIHTELIPADDTTVTSRRALKQNQKSTLTKGSLWNIDIKCSGVSAQHKYTWVTFISSDLDVFASRTCALRSPYNKSNKRNATLGLPTSQNPQILWVTIMWNVNSISCLVALSWRKRTETQFHQVA